MVLDPDFSFSQSSLQDYVDCQRRFQLRYLQHVAWPAVESEPVLENEHWMRQGVRFHLMLQQYACGVPGERLSAMANDAELGRWWQNFLEAAPTLFEPDAALYPEISLAAPLASYRLLAKYDLVARSQDGGLRIIDWKTARKRPRRAWLAGRLQTRLYPYLLVRAGQQLNHAQPIAPEQVELWYWFADFPSQPERFEYSTRVYREDEAYLSNLISSIQALGAADFMLTSHEERCAFCVYRSLCARGQQAGQPVEEESELELPSPQDLDFDQIAEIAF